MNVSHEPMQNMNERSAWISTARGWMKSEKEEEQRSARINDLNKTETETGIDLTRHVPPR